VFLKLHRATQEQLLYSSNFTCTMNFRCIPNKNIKLAAALANYDKDDFMTLKFLDMKTKEQTQSKKTLKEKSSVNQIETNLRVPRIKNSIFELYFFYSIKLFNAIIFLIESLFSNRLFSNRLQYYLIDPAIDNFSYPSL
jgi:hypothetical protein